MLWWKHTALCCQSPEQTSSAQSTQQRTQPMQQRTCGHSNAKINQPPAPAQHDKAMKPACTNGMQ
jgi:hypothetical protein